MAGCVEKDRDRARAWVRYHQVAFAVGVEVSDRDRIRCRARTSGRDTSTGLRSWRSRAERRRPRNAAAGVPDRARDASGTAAAGASGTGRRGCAVSWSSRQWRGRHDVAQLGDRHVLGTAVIPAGTAPGDCPNVGRPVAACRTVPTCVASLSRGCRWRVFWSRSRWRSHVGTNRVCRRTRARTGYCSRASIRRFCWRPSGVVFGATGLASP